MICRDHRPRILAKPVDALLDNSVRLTHLLNPTEIAIIAVTLDTYRNIKFQVIVHFVRLLLADIPFNTGATQHHSREAESQRLFRRNNPNTYSPLLPDAVVGKQCFVLIHISRETIGEILQKIKERPLSILIEFCDGLGTLPFGNLVLRHTIRKISINTTRPVVGCVHSSTRNRFVRIHEIFSLTEGVQHHRHRADIKSMRPNGKQVIQYPSDFIIEHTNVLRPDRNFDTKQPLDCHAIGVLITHHRHVVETIHVWNGLDPSSGFGKLLGAAMKETDMRIRALNNLTIEFEHQTQHPMCRRVLRSKVNGVVTNLSHDRHSHNYHRARCAAYSRAVRC